jgi:hypothetical protein
MSLQRSIFRLFVAATLTATSVQAFAQDYYEDDIYYNPSKKKTEQQTTRTKVASKASSTTQRYTYPTYNVGTVVADYAAADTYDLPVGRTDISVDDYNRNGQFLVADSVAADSLSDNDSFAYTRRIERFYNSDVVASSNDNELKEYYYSDDPVTSLNVYVIDPTWGWYGSPWSWRYWSPWHYAYYDPWGWSWGFSWGWDPLFSWSWGWGGPAWYPGHIHGFGGGFGGGHFADAGHNWRSSSVGASQTHRAAGLAGSSMRGRASAGYSPNGTSRPGNAYRGRYASSVNGSNSTGRNSSFSPSTGSSRNSSTSRSRVNSYNSNNSNSSSSSRNNSYNSNSSSNSYRSSGAGRTHSSGSFGGGGGFGGGSRGGGNAGGGGGRGRGR